VTTLVLHGFTGIARPVVRFFAAPVEAPDLPGHGSSSDATSWDDALDRLEPAIKARPVVLFGYSMGARLALGLALRHPDRITRLILESGTAGIEDPAERAQRLRDDRALADFIEERGLPAFVALWERHPTLASLAPLAADLRPERLSHRPQGLASALRHLGPGAQPSYWSDLPRLQMPVRIIAGARDEKFAAIGQRLRERIPHAELRLVDGCGHAPHLESPQAFTEALQ
jgi:2-succinyl-6-hydroxy-2,4-cyclohexadiene-1-carboxylate synthase